MIDRNSFKDVGRNSDHCLAIYRVRMNYGMDVLTEKNRYEFLVLTIAELYKGTDFARWIHDLYYDDKPAFDNMIKFLSIIATLDRDNREMERKGWFQKEKVLA